MNVKPLSQEIPLRSLLSDSEFVTKRGDVGTVLLTNPPDVECSEQETVNSVSERLTKAWRLLDTRFAVYQHWMRRKNESGLYANETYLTMLALRDNWTDKPSMFPASAAAWHERELTGRRALLSQKVKSWLEQVSDFWPMRVATKQEAFGLFYRLFNPAGKVPTLQGDLCIDKQCVDSEIAWTGWKDIQIGDRAAALLSLLYLPDDKRTFPHMLEPLTSLEAEFTVCVQSQGVPVARQKQVLKRAKGSQSEQEKGLSGAMQEEQTGRKIDDRMLNQEAVANTEALALAQREMAAGNRLCLFTLTVLVHAATPQELESSAESVKGALDLSLRMARESIRRKIAFFSMCPGARPLAHFREKKISEASLADFSQAFGTDAGQTTSAHLKAPAVRVFETRQRTPYYFNWHQSGVPHHAIFGKTGSGKSVLLNTLIYGSQKYKPYVSITDLGGSFEFLTRKCGGSHNRIIAGASNKIGWNPVGWPDSDEQRRFVVSLITMLVERRGRQLDDDQVEDVNQAVTAFYGSDGPYVLRNLVPFLPEEMQRPMRRWYGSGLDAWLLDNEVHDLRTDSDFNTDEWIGFSTDEYEYLLEPMFMCKFRYDMARFTDPKRLGQFKLAVFDEAWACVKSKRSAAFIRWALKMLRRYNTAVVLATQSEKDLSETALMAVINECCEKIFLANPGMKAQEYAETFGLEPRQLEAIQNLPPKGGLFVCSAGRSGKSLTNRLSRREALEYATDAPTVMRRNDAIEKHGDAWLDHMLDDPGRNGDAARSQAVGSRQT